MRVVSLHPSALSGSNARGATMIPEKQPPDREPSVEHEETKPEDSPEEDPDTARGEAFKRMFPDVPRKPELPKRSSD